MNSIAEIFDNSKQLLDSIENFFDKYIGRPLLRKCGVIKMVDDIFVNSGMTYFDNPISRLLGDLKQSPVLEKVVSAKDLLIDKLLVCFAPASAYLMFKTDTFFRDYKQDTFYRFDKLPGANWERLQLETAKNVILDIESQTTDKHINALIFDDSLYARTGGKGTELCARVFDHNDHKTRLGYRMMTGGWTNGETFIPFAQSLLSTRDEKQMVGPNVRIDCRTLRGKRRAMAKTKGTLVVQHMVKQAHKAGIPFDYVLFDTWFSSPSQLAALKGIGTDVIAMIKKNSTKYIWRDPATGEEKKLNVKEIYSRNKKRRGRSRYLLSVDIIIPDSTGNAMKAKLVYVRNHSNRKDWVCFVCTDMTLDEEKILRAYTMRWKIETYFKMSKSYLKLRTECHSTSYDAITSHMVIVAIRYMILAIERFQNTDNRSLEELFYEVQRDIINEMMDCAIILILDIMLQSVKQHFKASDEQTNGLLCTFIGNLPTPWRERFTMPTAA